MWEISLPTFQYPNNMIKKYIIFFVGICLFVPQPVFADCRGCCSGPGGIVCVNGVTRCAGGSPLSQGCLNKNCNVCPTASETITAPSTDNDYISIASFNIQVFGRYKFSKPKVMEILALPISQFDIVAVKEIRDKTGSAIKALEVAVDNLGTDYSFVIGPRLGRTSSKEQYALMYKTSLFQIVGSYTYADGRDAFHQETHIIHLSVVGKSFDFVIIIIHTDPDEATQETNSLPIVITNAQNHFNEKDVILLGDLNADGDYYDEKNNTLPLRDSAYTWLIANDVDTNVSASSRKVDRIFITASTREDYILNTAKTFRFE